jgi:flagellar basal-body rod protein FlgG
MMRASQIAATGMSAQQLNVEVISNNIANLNTTAYKRRLAEFQDLIYQSLNRDVGAQSNVAGNIPPVGNLVGLGVKVGGIFPNVTQGTLIQTGAAYDMAVQGKGLFKVTDANGTIYYTRDGRFSPNETGVLVNPQGYTLDPSVDVVEDNYLSVSINQEGEIVAILDDGNNTASQLGRITLAQFPNEAGLRPLGNNLYTVTEASGPASESNPGEDGFGTLQTGFIEASNVDAVYEITTLITAQRAYELNSRVISTADDMLNAINNIR